MFVDWVAYARFLPNMAQFEFATATRIIFGSNTATELPKLIDSLQSKRPLVVTGKAARYATVLQHLQGNPKPGHFAGSSLCNSSPRSDHIRSARRAERRDGDARSRSRQIERMRLSNRNRRRFGDRRRQTNRRSRHKRRRTARLHGSRRSRSKDHQTRPPVRCHTNDGRHGRRSDEELRSVVA